MKTFLFLHVQLRLSNINYCPFLTESKNVKLFKIGPRHHHHHHQFSALRQVLGTQTFQASLSSALLFMFTYDVSFKSSSIPVLGLPLPLLPSILPSITCFSNPCPLATWPIQFFFLFNILCRILLCSPMPVSTCSFVFLSFQLTLSILLHAHISKAFILSTSSFLIVHVSLAYIATGHTKDLINLFLTSTLKDFVINSLLLLKASLAIPILTFTSSNGPRHHGQIKKNLLLHVKQDMWLSYRGLLPYLVDKAAPITNRLKYY